MDSPRRGVAAWVTSDELEEWLAEGRPVSVVDVRTPEEFAAGHLAAAVNLPDTSTAELVRWITVKQGLVVLVCGDGTLSRQVACTLDFCGFRDVAYLADGMRVRGHPDEGSAPPRVIEDDRVALRLLRTVATALNARVVAVALLGSAVVMLGFLLRHA